MKRMILGLVIVASLMGCTDKQMARQFGGTTTENLPAGKKLMNATWKQDNLWILTRPMRADEKPETYEFKESSSFGLVQGSVVIVENK